VFLNRVDGGAGDTGEAQIYRGEDSKAWWGACGEDRAASAVTEVAYRKSNRPWSRGQGTQQHRRFRKAEKVPHQNTEGYQGQGEGRQDEDGYIEGVSW